MIGSGHCERLALIAPTQSGRFVWEKENVKERICSFRGPYANPGNGMERVSFDAGARARLARLRVFLPWQSYGKNDSVFYCRLLVQTAAYKRI